MSDYNPNLGPGPDKYGRYDYQDPNDGGGRAGWALLAVLGGVAVVGGFLYFGNPTNTVNEQQAQAPERTLTEPARPNPGATVITPPPSPSPRGPQQTQPAQE